MAQKWLSTEKLWGPLPNHMSLYGASMRHRILSRSSASCQNTSEIQHMMENATFICHGYPIGLCIKFFRKHIKAIFHTKV